MRCGSLSRDVFVTDLIFFKTTLPTCGLCGLGHNILLGVLQSGHVRVVGACAGDAAQDENDEKSARSHHDALDGRIRISWFDTVAGKHAHC